MSDSARDALVERLFGAVLGFNDVLAVYIGDRLGLYDALRDRGPLTSAELAEETGTNERYAREWLEHQAVGGILAVDGEDGARRYALPAGHDEVLCDPDSLSFMAAFARMTVGMAAPLPNVLEAFRTGAGVPYADYPDDFLLGQGAMNRVQFVALLGREWLPSIADVHARLQAGGRVADLACGTGWSSVAIARAYPDAVVHGYDSDPTSIAEARATAASEGLDGRIRFEVADVAQLAEGEFDLVLVIEALHDMSRPVEALAAMRRLAGDEGAVVVVDERAAEAFTAPGDDVERMLYGWSILHCLPVGMAEQPSAATGTAMRPETLRSYAEQAGFHDVEVLPVENDFWRFYRLR